MTVEEVLAKTEFEGEMTAADHAEAARIVLESLKETGRPPMPGAWPLRHTSEGVYDLDGPMAIFPELPVEPRVE
jgi:hypothetical protein